MTHFLYLNLKNGYVLAPSKGVSTCSKTKQNTDEVKTNVYNYSQEFSECLTIFQVAKLIYLA